GAHARVCGCPVRGALGRRRRGPSEGGVKRAPLLAVLMACNRGEHREAREKYNEGVDLLVKGDHEAAEKALLDARSSAGVDPDLLFRAAYDLGYAYDAHATKVKTGKDADLAKAAELE